MRIFKYTIFVLCMYLFAFECYAQEQDANALLEEFYKWKITLFAGPGKKENRVTSIAINKDQDKITSIYALSLKKIPDPDLHSIYTRSFLEFKWNGESWEKTETNAGDADGWGVCIGMDYAALRPGDETKRLYFATLNGVMFEYEYSETRKEWIKVSQLDTTAYALFTQGFAVGGRLKNEEKKYLYCNTREIYWNGNNWVRGGNFNIESERPSNSRISSISFGNWGEEENCAYCLSSSGDMMIELKWNGSSWQEISKLNTNCMEQNSGMISRPFSFVADLGKGRRLYTLGNFGDRGGRIKECVKDNLKWEVYDLVAGGAKASAITYGRISSQDPISLYSIIPGEGAGGNFDIMREYTFINKKWRITWNAELKEQGMEITERLGGYNITDLCMADGRNDDYNRLYIVDSLSNIWECSVPPRELRPLVDEFGNIIYGPDGKPMYPGGTGGAQIQKNKIIPSILGK